MWVGLVHASRQVAEPAWLVRARAARCAMGSSYSICRAAAPHCNPHLLPHAPCTLCAYFLHTAPGQIGSQECQAALHPPTLPANTWRASHELLNLSAAAAFGRHGMLQAAAACLSAPTPCMFTRGGGAPWASSGGGRAVKVGRPGAGPTPAPPANPHTGDAPTHRITPTTRLSYFQMCMKCRGVECNIWAAGRSPALSRWLHPCSQYGIPC